MCKQLLEGEKAKAFLSLFENDKTLWQIAKLVYVDGLKYSEVATIVGYSERQIGRLCKRIRQIAEQEPTGGMTPKFMEHIHIDVPKDLTPKFDEFGNMVVSATNQMIVQQVEGIDDAICKQIHDMAVANGIDDVYVLDKKQILSALEKQIPKKPSETDKARCIHCACVVRRDERFCKNCGQALDWGDSE